MSHPSALAGLACACLVACDLDRPPPGGTSVGNPGKTELQLARIDGLELGAATVSGLRIDWLGCDGERAGVQPDDGRSVVVGGAEPLEVPPGAWCGMAIAVGELVVSGTVPADGEGDPVPVEVVLVPELVPTLWMAAPVVVDETAYVLELGAPGFATGDDLRPVEGEVAAADRAARLVLELIRGTTWYEDDGDGVLDEDERATGAVASGLVGPPPEFHAADAQDTGADTSVGVDGCNCDAAAPPARLGLGLLAAALGVAARRRRR